LNENQKFLATYVQEGKSFIDHIDAEANENSVQQV
jgi:hypothetical protein